MSEVIFVMLNKISFKLSTETFGCDNEPTDVVEIYIDGEICVKRFHADYHCGRRNYIQVL